MRGARYNVLCTRPRVFAFQNQLEATSGLVVHQAKLLRLSPSLHRLLQARMFSATQKATWAAWGRRGRALSHIQLAIYGNPSIFSCLSFPTFSLLYIFSLSGSLSLRNEKELSARRHFFVVCHFLTGSCGDLFVSRGWQVIWWTRSFVRPSYGDRSLLRVSHGMCWRCRLTKFEYLILNIEFSGIFKICVFQV